MALVAKEKYDSAKMDKHLNYLQLYAEKGRPLDYEIIVDGMKVVRRTDEPQDFQNYSSFVDADTKAIELLIYNGTSNNNDRYIYTLSEPAKESLSGIDIDAKITEQVERHKRDIEYATLQREHSELKREVTELEKEIEQLEADNKTLQDQQSPFKGLLGEIGSTFVESFIRRNPQIMKSIPGGEALAGLINVPGKSEQPDAEGSVTFQPKNASHELTEDQQAAVSFVDQLKIQFTKEEFDRVVLILQALAENKQRIDIVLNTVVNQ